MAKIKLPADGQEFELDDEIAKDDATLRKALTPVYPDAATATFQRSQKDNVLTVTVIKKAGTKGGVIESLLKAPGYTNEVYAMKQKLAEMDSQSALTFDRIKEMEDEIEKALTSGEEASDQVAASMQVLVSAEPQASLSTPIGF